MASKNRFMAPSEYGNNVKKSLFTRLSAGSFVLFFAISSSFLSIPVTLLAEDQQPAETKNTAPANTTEGLLATTEQMIEQLILQIESQKNNNSESRELSDNSNPAPYFSSMPNIKPVSGSITSSFGRRLHPIYNVVLFHSGIDFAASRDEIGQLSVSFNEMAATLRKMRKRDRESAHNVTEKLSGLTLLRQCPFRSGNC